MGDNTRWVVGAFLDELSALKLKDTAPPMHVVEKRLLLAGMVLDEVADDDLEGVALRALADSVVNLCWTPMDPDAVEDFLAARRFHLDVAAAAYNSVVSRRG